jgi:hypothetical protein
MHMCCDYTIPLFELSTISEMPMNKASRFSGCIYSGRLLYNSRQDFPRFYGITRGNVVYFKVLLRCLGVGCCDLVFG